MQAGAHARIRTHAQLPLASPLREFFTSSLGKGCSHLPSTPALTWARKGNAPIVPVALPSQARQARTCLGPKVEKLRIQGLASFPLPFPGSSQASPGPHPGPSQGTAPRAHRGLHPGPAYVFRWGSRLSPCLLLPGFLSSLDPPGSH